MNVFDRQFQPGSPFLIALFSALALASVVLAAAEPEHGYVLLFVSVLALNGAWKHHRARSRFGDSTHGIQSL